MSDLFTAKQAAEISQLRVNLVELDNALLRVLRKVKAEAEKGYTSVYIQQQAIGTLDSPKLVSALTAELIKLGYKVTMSGYEDNLKVDWSDETLV